MGVVSMSKRLGFRPCKVAGCERNGNPALVGCARGFCAYHYGRWRAGKSLSNVPKLTHANWIIQMACSRLPDHCVTFPGGTNNRGYGLVDINTKRVPAHRLALIIYSGEDRPGYHAAHGPCNNTSCVNPLHLSWKTISENQRDRIRDGTDNRGSKSAVAKLTEEQVREVMLSSLNGAELARQFGVSPSNIYCIRTRKTWRHIKV